MMRTTALLAVLVLLLAACGGITSDVVDADAPPTGETASVESSEPAAATPTTESSSPSADADSAGTPAPIHTATEEPGTMLTLSGSGLPAGDYTVTVNTADTSFASIQRFDGQTFLIDLGDTDPADVGAVNVHAGLDAAGPPILSGTLTAGSGTLTVATPVDLTGASGQYILATPTNGGDSDERSGIWYVLIPRAPGLVLPALPAEWVYEGWVTVDGVDLTTGRFGDPAAADDFDGFSGDQGGPPLPGEDFLVNAPDGSTFPVDLAGMTTFVTLEPAEDADPGPSGLTILSGQIPPDAGDHTVYDLTATVDALPEFQATAS